MAWTELNRRQHVREDDRYASDLTDVEGALINPLVPRLRRTGRLRTTYLRDVFDAILYVATTGCQWRMLHTKNKWNLPSNKCIIRNFFDFRTLAAFDKQERHTTVIS